MDPAKILSVELLIEILWQCVLDQSWRAFDQYPEEDDDLTDRSDAGLAPQRPCRLAPWTFAQVSKWWRRVALANPKLWTFISITENSSRHFYQGYRDSDASKREGESSILRAKDQCLALQLERSRTQPLVVKLDGSLKSLLCTSPGFQQLLACSHRWKHLLYALAGSSSIALVYEVDKHLAELPVLEYLRISPSQFNKLIAIPPHFITKAPKLHSYQLEIHNPNELPNPHWAQITTLDTNVTGSFPYLLEILGQMARLDTLKLRFERHPCYMLSRLLAIPDPLLLSTIRSLTIRAGWDSSDLAFAAPFQTFTVPALESLVLEDPGWRSYTVLPINDLRNMLKRGGTNLKHLRLDTFKLPESNFEHWKLFLAEVVSLEKLELVGVASGAIRMFALEIQKRDVVPALRELTLAKDSDWRLGTVNVASDVQRLRAARPHLLVDSSW
ncbi:hypothetical protein C8J56DRAFT_330902 [Mycena floridula]|nr:hypothetical protein C8J56DRAFT_330902 [Mycena floridula]